MGIFYCHSYTVLCLNIDRLALLRSNLQWDNTIFHINPVFSLGILDEEVAFLLSKRLCWGYIVRAHILWLQGVQVTQEVSVWLPPRKWLQLIRDQFLLPQVGRWFKKIPPSHNSRYTLDPSQRSVFWESESESLIWKLSMNNVMDPVSLEHRRQGAWSRGGES